MSDTLDQFERARDAWPGDPELAAFNKEWKIKAPLERIRETDILLTSFNADKLLPRGERVVVLECRHLDVVKITAMRKRCSVCQDMIERGADYDLFRHQ